MTGEFPTQAQVVVIGGGIAGCSVAYHLTKLGWRDVLLLERGRLTCGTTWHAAGLVGQMRPIRPLSLMSRYSVELYARLQAETGLATGWKRCGSINLAATPERLIQQKRGLTIARSVGIDIEPITPSEVAKLWPLMRTDDLTGAVWLPGDGKVNPTDLTQSLARGARNGGARLIEGSKVTGFNIRDQRVVGVRTEQGAIACEAVVNCGGQWAREIGRLAGVNVPLVSAEHSYIVTRKIPDVTPDLPVVRDPDGHIYYKEEVGGLVMGGTEPMPRAWAPDPIPDGFEFRLLPEDWDRFQPLMASALHRTPCLATAQVRQLVNGPESFTPDGNFILGEAPGLAGFFVAAGFNSSGIANAGGAGRLLAEWIVGGEPGVDLWDVDIRRFAPHTANRRYLTDRTLETVGRQFAIHWPREEPVSARPLRRSALHDRLAAKGAHFGVRMGWERANYFAPRHARVETHRFGKPDWLPYCLDEQKAARESVVVFDQTSFAKLLLQGRDAETVLQRLCANDVAVAPGRIVYTAMLNRRGGFECDMTVTSLADNVYFIVTGAATAVRDMDGIERRIGGSFANLTDVTSAWAVLSVMGPRSRELLSHVSRDDFAEAAFLRGACRDVDVGYARCRAACVSYIGGHGFELYVPTECATTVYDALSEAGADLGLADAGYYALDVLALEAGRRHFGAELGPDDTPVEAGLMSAVRLDKSVPFVGRDALLRQQELGVRKRLATLALDDPEAFPWGGEAILRDGQVVGEVTSAGYSARLSRAIVMGYVRAEHAIDRAYVQEGRYEIDIASERFSAKTLARPVYPWR
jgi:4-methylaminobutanoate oxidase (formaldehyde-forming)